jgi:hypothetical protein
VIPVPAILLDQVITRWECPNCLVTDVTRGLVPNRYHTCAGLHMLTAPLVRAGTDCKLTASVREDYLGAEVQRTGDDGRPYMNVVTEHADGHTDLAVFSPVARGYL